MFNKRIIKSGLKTIWSHKLRAFFMIIGIMVGIAALTVIISLGKGTEEQIMKQVNQMFSPNTILIVAGQVDTEDGPRDGGSLTSLKLEDIRDAAGRVDNVIDWDAIQMAPNREAEYESNNTIVTVSGQTSNLENVWDIDLISGRFFTDTEDKNLSRVAILGPNVKKELFGDSDPVGQQIRISNVPFEVIGVIGPRGLDPHGIDKDSEVIIPINTLLRRVVNLDYIMMGKVLLADIKEMDKSVKEITEIIKERHNITLEKADFTLITPKFVMEMVANATKMFNLYLPLVAGVSLFVGGIVIVNLMLISVSERIFEIGLRKAVGAKSKDILFQFITEASLLTFLSGIVGVFIGLLVLSQLAPLMNIPFSISWSAVLGCFTISVIVGIIAGVYPAKKAADMVPMEALK